MVKKIRVELEIPDNDCWNCLYSRVSYQYVVCNVFDADLSKIENNRNIKRCQQCLDAEVSKEDTP